jgi:mannose-6-phosphate isomerase-like protein (cupin superfamily)
MATPAPGPTPAPECPAPLINPATGERFEFVSSACRGDGRFRFRWTLEAGRRGPPEHRHLAESETFTLRSGRLRVWIDDQPRDLERNVAVTAPVGSHHRFLNPGDEPAVVDVELDGQQLEDTLVPMGAYFAGRPPTLAEVLRIMVHDRSVGATVQRSPLVSAAISLVAAAGRLAGLRRFPPVSW